MKGSFGGTKLWCASCSGGMFRDLSGRQLLLELNGKVCSSETSVSEFGLWRKSVEGKVTVWKCHLIHEAVDGYFHLKEMQ